MIIIWERYEIQSIKLFCSNGSTRICHVICDNVDMISHIHWDAFRVHEKIKSQCPQKRQRISNNVFRHLCHVLMCVSLTQYILQIAMRNVGIPISLSCHYCCNGELKSFGLVVKQYGKPCIRTSNLKNLIPFNRQLPHMFETIHRIWRKYLYRSSLQRDLRLAIRHLTCRSGKWITTIKRTKSTKQQTNQTKDQQPNWLQSWNEYISSTHQMKVLQIVSFQNIQEKSRWKIIWYLKYRYIGNHYILFYPRFSLLLWKTLLKTTQRTWGIYIFC